MRNKIPYFILIILVSFLSGCSWLYKGKTSTATLLKVETSSKQDLLNEVQRFSRVTSLKAKMDLQYEDTTAAKTGSKLTYATVNGDLVVQRPANILIGVNVLGVDLAKMSSNGETFQVAILKDQDGGKFRKFVIGTNKADYTKLQNQLAQASSEVKTPGSFANLRPQHLTDALLIRPIDQANTYLVSTIFINEDDPSQKKGSPLRMLNRGYYLLDEFGKADDGEARIIRRFWFDRVGGIRLARQQLFDAAGEIESDITYGKQGQLTTSGEYSNLPLQIRVTRPKEKYMMNLEYQAPESVTIGKNYPATAFILKNDWGLDVVDLDQRLQGTSGQQSAFNK